MKNSRWEKIEYRFDDGVIPDRSLAFSMAFGFTFKSYENTIFLFGGLGPCQDTQKVKSFTIPTQGDPHFGFHEDFKINKTSNDHYKPERFFYLSCSYVDNNQTVIAVGSSNIIEISATKGVPRIEVTKVGPGYSSISEDNDS